MDLKVYQTIHDSLVRHQTYLERFGAGLYNRTKSLFEDKMIFAAATSKKKMTKQINKIIKSEKEAITTEIMKELRQMARLELSYMKQLAEDFKDLKLTKKQIDALMKEALKSPVVVNNTTLGDVYDAAFDRKEQIASTINTAVSYGMKDIAIASAEITAALSQFGNSMKAFDLTYANKVASGVREKAYKESKAVERVVMNAVLDGRTTPFCMDIDGNIYPKDEGPRPPFHIRCRTVAMPVVAGVTDEEVGEMLSYRAQILPGDEYEKGDAKKLRSTKAQVQKGKVKVVAAGSGKKSSTSYSDFLASQTKTKVGRQFIMDRLGVKKGKAYMKLLDDGVDPKKALGTLLKVPAKDLDIDGLKDRIIKESKISKATKVKLLESSNPTKIMNDLKKRYPDEYDAYSDSVPFGKVSLIKMKERVRQFEEYLNEGKAPAWVGLKHKLEAAKGPKSITMISQLKNDPDADAIASNGKFYGTSNVIQKLGKDGECHWNSGDLFTKGEIDNIVIGYAQNTSGWHQHTWGLKGGKVVETTKGNLDAIGYYGLKLTEEESKEFAKYLKKNAPGLGLVRTKTGTFRVVR